MKIINEVQGLNDFTQDMPLDILKTLVDRGHLVHVQTSRYGDRVHRYFVFPEDAHPYRVNDYNTGKMGVEALDEYYMAPREF